MNPTHDPPDQILAGALRQLRHHSGSTQEEVAHHAGITVTALARIERGTTNPRWTTVRRIITALNASLDDLITAVEDARV